MGHFKAKNQPKTHGKRSWVRKKGQVRLRELVKKIKSDRDVEIIIRIKGESSYR